MSSRLSVVISTYNRLPLLQELLDALGKQTLDPKQFEVLVVDDGSRVPAAPALAQRKDPFQLTVITQANAGAAAARHAGVERATGDVVVITDDDMLVPPDFLAEHLAAHDAGYTLVLGHMIPDEVIADQPLFDRFHIHSINQFIEHFRDRPTEVSGVNLCTGNVSFRRAEYIAVGGFDRSLDRSEDRDLGVRLEEAGAKLFFADKARTTNRSDHTDLKVWLRRNFNYGLCDARIGHKHPHRLDVNPWDYVLRVNPVSRPLLVASALAPGFGFLLSRATYKVAETVDRARKVHPVFERVGLAGATLSYGLEYFRGVRSEAGSLPSAVKDLGTHLFKRLLSKGA